MCCSNKDSFEDDLDIHEATEESLGETNDTNSDEQLDLKHEVEDTMQMVFGEGTVYTDESEDEDIDEYTCICCSRCGLGIPPWLCWETHHW